MQYRNCSCSIVPTVQKLFPQYRSCARSAEIVAAIQLVDLELNYRVSDNLSVVIGANNALNTFPTQIKTRMSQGMPYPRRTPIGYHGGMMFTRLTYNF